MQIEVAPSEHFFLQSVQRLKEAIEGYNSAVQELRAATKVYEDCERVLVPQIPEIHVIEVRT